MEFLKILRDWIVPALSLVAALIASIKAVIDLGKDSFVSMSWKFKNRLEKIKIFRRIKGQINDNRQKKIIDIRNQDLFNDIEETIAWKNYQRRARGLSPFSIFMPGYFSCFILGVFGGLFIFLLGLMIFLNFQMKSDEWKEQEGMISFICGLFIISGLGCYFLGKLMWKVHSELILRASFKRDVLLPFRYWNRYDYDYLLEESFRQSFCLIRLREKQCAFHKRLICIYGSLTAVSFCLALIFNQAFSTESEKLLYVSWTRVIGYLLVLVALIHGLRAPRENGFPKMPIKKWNHNSAYFTELVTDAARRKGLALDIGCGDGELISLLSQVCSDVVGIDTDVEATTLAKQYHISNCEVLCEDFLTSESPRLRNGSFDTITCVACLHLLPMEKALIKIRDLLRPGGKLLIIGLYNDKTFRDKIITCFGFFPVKLAGLIHHEKEREKMAIQKPNESFKEIGIIARRILPDCSIRRRFFHRYSLYWCKNEGNTIAARDSVDSV